MAGEISFPFSVLSILVSRPTSRNFFTCFYMLPIENDVGKSAGKLEQIKDAFRNAHEALTNFPYTTEQTNILGTMNIIRITQKVRLFSMLPCVTFFCLIIYCRPSINVHIYPISSIPGSSLYFLLFPAVRTIDHLGRTRKDLRRRVTSIDRDAMILITQNVIRCTMVLQRVMAIDITLVTNDQGIELFYVLLGVHL